MSKKNSVRKTTAVIIDRLVTDISDRRGLRQEWEQIDDDVREDEIFPAWRKIIKEEIDSLLESK